MPRDSFETMGPITSYLEPILVIDMLSYIYTSFGCVRRQFAQNMLKREEGKYTHVPNLRRKKNESLTRAIEGQLLTRVVRPPEDIMGRCQSHHPFDSRPDCFTIGLTYLFL